MKNTIKHIISLFCCVMLFFIVYEALKYALIDDTSKYTRLTFHQMYDAPENIDVLFVGSSHVYKSLVPEITDEEFQAYTFNAGSSAQAMDASLAVIKEALRIHDIKKIYLEMYYSMAISSPQKERSQLTSTYIISDYMKNIPNRILFLINASSKEYYFNSFVIPARNRSKLSDPGYIRDLLKKKQTSDYKNYIWNPVPDSTEQYVDRGFVSNTQTVSPDNLWVDTAYEPISINSITRDWRDNISEIIRLCKKENVQITFFVSPMPYWVLQGKGNYDEYKKILSSLSTEYDVDYYDFNYIKPDYFDTSDPSLFADNSHLNTTGAEAFSRLFGQVMTGKINDKDMFYNSLKEKSEAQLPRIFGLAGPYNEDTDIGISCAKIISNDENLEYRISIQADGKEPDIIQDFNNNKYFSFPAEGSQKITIDWKTPEDPARIHTEYFTYEGF